MSCEDNLVKNELCNIYDLYNIISEPTCFKRPEGTLIDPIIVRSKNRFKKSINVFCGYSDHHNLVGCITKLQVPIKKPKKITYRSLKHFDENIFKGEVSMIPFHISNKEFFDAVGPFMNNKCRLQRNFILKEDDQIITDTTEICEIFSTFFSSCVNNIKQPDEIDMSELDFLIKL